jgi:o-succinylbenzoate synthase
MKIDRVTLHIVRMELIHAFQASSHSARDLHHILVRAEAGGLVGWGECSVPNDPFYMGETYETCWHILKDFLLPRVIGKEWRDIPELVGMYSIIKGNPFAKSGFETAAWDLLAQSQGKSLSSMLGGTRTSIFSGVSLGIEKDAATLLGLIEDYVAQGYRRVKIKIAPGRDVDVVRAVRERFPALPLMVDANAAYTLDDIDALRKLDPFDLMMIEQPLAWDDLLDHAELQKHIKTPVCLDESIRSAADARRAVALGSCKIVNAKVARVGGLLEAKRIHDICHEAGMAVWVGGMHDYGVGRAANIALASLPGFTIPGDISGSDKYWVEDIVEPPIVAAHGEIQVPTGAGLGHRVVEARVEERSIRSVTL